jgi:hypothetical protein
LTLDFSAPRTMRNTFLLCKHLVYGFCYSVPHEDNRKWQNNFAILLIIPWFARLQAWIFFILMMANTYVILYVPSTLPNNLPSLPKQLPIASIPLLSLMQTQRTRMFGWIFWYHTANQWQKVSECKSCVHSPRMTCFFTRDCADTGLDQMP